MGLKVALDMISWVVRCLFGCVLDFGLCFVERESRRAGVEYMSEVCTIRIPVAMERENNGG